jgi:hypothetical protein
MAYPRLIKDTPFPQGNKTYVARMPWKGQFLAFFNGASDSWLSQIIIPFYKFDYGLDFEIKTCSLSIECPANIRGGSIV